MKIRCLWPLVNWIRRKPDNFCGMIIMVWCCVVLCSNEMIILSWNVVYIDRHISVRRALNFDQCRSQNAKLEYFMFLTPFCRFGKIRYCSFHSDWYDTHARTHDQIAWSKMKKSVRIHEELEFHTSSFCSFWTMLKSSVRFDLNAIKMFQD